MTDNSHHGVVFKGLLVLLGYMGSGKSTVGSLLAKHLDLPFIDLDQYIETQYGSSIPEIFSEKGAVYFRKIEHQCLENLLKTHKNLVLALGGGAPCYHNNMALINNATPHSFYLAPSVTELANRLFSKRHKRPLIAQIEHPSALKEFVAKHIFERAPFYEQAQYVLRINADQPEEMIEAVLNKLG